MNIDWFFSKTTMTLWIKLLKWTLWKYLSKYKRNNVARNGWTEVQNLSRMQLELCQTVCRSVRTSIMMTMKEIWQTMIKPMWMIIRSYGEKKVKYERSKLNDIYQNFSHPEFLKSHLTEDRHPTQTKQKKVHSNDAVVSFWPGDIIPSLSFLLLFLSLDWTRCIDWPKLARYDRDSLNRPVFESTLLKNVVMVRPTELQVSE